MRYKLLIQVSSNTKKSSRLFGEINDEVSLIAQMGDVSIVEGKKGRFSVNIKHLKKIES